MRATDQITSRYSIGAIILHWLIAAALIFEIGVGWRMDAPRSDQTFAVYQLHKSVGITILLLTLLRIVWRLLHRPPAFPPHLKRWERTSAHLVHIGLYGLMLGLPLTGWLMVSTSKTVIPTLLYYTVPWPNVPGTATLAAGARAAVNNVADLGHHAFIYSAYALIALHVAGALKHHLIDRGDDFARMMPVRGRSLLSVLVALVVVIAIGVFALGNRIHLGGRSAAAPAPVVAAPVAPPEVPVEAAAANITAPAEEKTSATPATATAPDAVVAPVRWRVDRKASTLGFATSWSGAAVTGQFGSWTADILFDPNALDTSKVSVSIVMTSAKTGVSDTEEALPGDDWFATAMYPTATFTSKSFRKLAGDRYEARGTLKMRGVERPLTLPFTLTIKDKQANMSGKAQIDRTIFGVGQGQWASTDAVSGTVTVNVAIKATRP